MTIREAIYSVFNGVNISTDDFPIRSRFVYRELLITVNELKKQELNKYRLLDYGSAQTLQSFRLVREDLSISRELSTGIDVLRSEETLPAALETDFGNGILGVFFLNGVEIEPLSRSDWDNRKKRRYSLPGACGYMIENRKLLIVDYDEVDEVFVDVNGHYEHPEEITLRNRKISGKCEDAVSCIPVQDLEFECPSHIIRRAVEIVRPVVLRALGIPIDTNNNLKYDVESKP